MGQSPGLRVHGAVRPAERPPPGRPGEQRQAGAADLHARMDHRSVGTIHGPRRQGPRPELASRQGIYLRLHLCHRRGRMCVGGWIPAGLVVPPAPDEDRGAEVDPRGRAHSRSQIHWIAPRKRPEPRHEQRPHARDPVRLAAGGPRTILRHGVASRRLAIPLPGSDELPLRRRKARQESAAPGSRKRFDPDHRGRRRAVRHPVSGGRLSPPGASGRLGSRGLRHGHVQPGRRDRRAPYLEGHALPGGGQPDHHPPEASRSGPEPALSGSAGNGCGRRQGLVGAGGGLPACRIEPGPVRGGDSGHAGAAGGGAGAHRPGAR